MLIALSAYSGQAVIELADGGTESFGSVTSGSFLTNTPIYSFVVVSVMCMLGLYDHDIRDAINSIALRVLISFMLVAVSQVLFFIVIPNCTLGSGSLVVAPLVACFFSIGSRHAFASFIYQRFFQEPRVPYVAIRSFHCAASRTSSNAQRTVYHSRKRQRTLATSIGYTRE